MTTLDLARTRRVMFRVLADAGDRGVLVITHATDTLFGFDRVVELHGGELRSDDPHGAGARSWS